MNRDLKARSCQDRIRPGVIVIVAAAILAAVAIPFAVIRAMWPQSTPVSSTPTGKPTDHSSSDECVVTFPEGVNRIKIAASNGVLLLDLGTADPAKRLSVEVGQASVLCRPGDGQKPVRGRSVRLTHGGMTVFQCRDGKVTLTIDGSTTGIQAIGDRIYDLKDGKKGTSSSKGVVFEFDVPQSPPQGEAGFPQTRPAAPRRQQPIYWQARRLPN